MYKSAVASAPGWRLIRGSLLTGCLVTLLGCSTEALLERDQATGGLVTFPIESADDILSSSGRRSALRIIDDKCPGGARIVREGEVPKVSRTADRAWGGQIGTNRLWGIQFTCK